MDWRIEKVYCFTSTFVQIILAMREEHSDELQRLMKDVDRYCEEFKTWLDKAISPSILCRRIYGVLDPLIKRDMDAAVTCRQGCAHCCHQFVSITRSEAKHLVRVAAAKGIAIDRERLTIQSTKEDLGWAHLPREQAACVFLDPITQRCRVYEDRPLACRKYHVINEPALCNIETNNETPVSIHYQLDSELVATAWMTVDGGNNLAKLLLEELP